MSVRLNQAWTTGGTVDSLYYTYREDSFTETCHEKKDVQGSTFYEDLTIKCYFSQPVTLIGICVADDGGALDATSDDAVIPECCDDAPEPIPAVCYKIIIRCESLCTRAGSRHHLQRVTIDSNSLNRVPGYV